MDEVILRPLCDLCETRTPAIRRVVTGTAAVPVEAGTEATALPRPDLMVVDLCAEHLDRATDAGTLAAHGRALFASGGRVGRPAGSPAAQADRRRIPTRCPVCPDTITRANMIKHLVAMHEWVPPKQPKRCPDCGRRTGGDAAGQPMQTHRAINHGYDYLAAVIEANR